MTRYYLYKDRDDRREEGILQVLRHNLKSEKKAFSIEYREDGQGCGYLDIREYWTNLSGEELGDKGFKKADGFLDLLRYSFTKQYAKLEGFKEADPPDDETAESLRRFAESRTLDRMRSGFKTSMSPLQMKQIVVIIPIAIGAILGLFLLFGGGL